MRILIAHNFYRSHQIGGEDRVVEQEVQALREVVGENNLHTYFVYNDQLDPKKLIWDIWGSRHHAHEIQKSIQKNNINLLHVHNEFPLLTPSVFKAAREVKCKTIQTLHNFRRQCLAGTLFQKNQVCERCVENSFKWPGILKKCYRGSVAQSALHALAQYRYDKNHIYDDVDYYFALTKFQRDKLLSFGMPRNKLLIKPNFVLNPSDLNLDLSALAKRDTYYFIGRLEPGKGIDNLLNTWVQLPKPLKLNIIGTGDCLNQYRTQYQAYPNIQFLGKLEHQEVLDHLKTAKYLLHTSLYYETFGLTMLEALSLGVPVIGYYIGTRPEFIQNGINGFLGDSKDLQQLILEGEHTPDYAKLCEHAQASAAPYHSERVIKKQLSYYQQIMAGRRIYEPQ